MADDLAVRPIRRIKIKFGSTVVTTQAVRVPGLGSSASQDSKDTKAGSALHLARLRQASLRGYVPPSASVDAIVARLREGEGFAPGAELPAWDFTAPCTRNCLERPAKRSRQLASADTGCLDAFPVPGAEQAVGAPSLRGPGLGSRRPEPGADGKDLPAKAEPASERAGTVGGSGESNSDQATNSQAYLPLSPDDAGDGAGRAPAVGVAQPHASSAGQSSLASSAQLSAMPPQRPRPPPVAALIAGPSTSAAAASAQAKERGLAAIARGLPSRAVGLPPAVAARGDLPSTSGRQQLPAPPVTAPHPATGVSAETQTTQRDFPILPTSFLELPRLSGTALSYQNIGPFDLQLEQEQGPRVLEGRVEAHIEEARRVKREGDQLFNRNGKVWTIKSLSKYLSASLMFMEAADAMLKEKRASERDHRHAPGRAAGLYRQTADLLVHTVNYADMLKGNGVGKEALRLLAERLCAICLLRQTSLMASSFKSCADKAQLALKEHQRQQAAHWQGAAAAAGSAGGGQQPSPQDSSTSSLHAAHGASVGGAALAGGGAGGSAAAQPAPAGGSSAHGGGGGAQSLPGFGPEQVQDLVSYARTTSRFSDYMRRSSKSFEAFLERADVRQDQQAKLVCMHLAAVCMDMGMGPNTRVISHAREAVRTLCEDLAR